MKRIAIFASGEGTNAEAIIDHFTCSSNFCRHCGVQLFYHFYVKSHREVFW